MYNNLTYLKDIHVFSKIFSFVFCLLSILLVNNLVYYLVIIGLFFVLFQEKKVLILEEILLFLTYLFNPFSIILKIIFVISLLVFFVKIINLEEIRYFIETLFYKKRKVKISYVSLHVCYFFKYYFKYFNELLILLKSYGKKIDFYKIKYIIVESYTKTKNKIQDLMILYRYRFYNSSGSRTYYEKNKITSLDIKYMLIFVIVFFIIYVYGR